MFRKYEGRIFFITPFFWASLCFQYSHGQLETGWKAHDLSRPAPKVVCVQDVPSVAPPSDAVVLFGGQDLSNWKGAGKKWKVVDGVIESAAKAGPLTTKEEFGDCQLHVEWMSPAKVKGAGQGRGNSGVFLMGRFEIQVLDSFQNKTFADGTAGAVYGQFPPLVNASRKPGQWQIYDIVFRAPRFDEDRKLVRRARVTVLHNGVLIQDNTEFLGPTQWIKHERYVPGKTTGPIRLQDHGNPVRFKNIWVRRLATERPLPEKSYPLPSQTLTADQRKRLVGKYYCSRGQPGFRIKEEGETLVCQFLDVKMKMVPHSEAEFSFEKCAGEIKFEIDDEGAVASARLALDAAGWRLGRRKKK